MARSTASRSLASALLLALALASPLQARTDRTRAMTFESGSPYGARLDSTMVHEGRYSARIERTATSPQTFSALGFEIPVDFRADTLELRGWMKYEGVTGFVGLWQRQDGVTTGLQFDNMQKRGLTGTAEWAEYRVALPLSPQATRVTVGALLTDRGRLWVDDLRLYVDGKPLAEVPEIPPTPTVLDRDHEFDAGSKVAIAGLTPVQVDDLVLLGKVWGFLKYHHPEVVAGRRHWDYDLFRALPRVLAARGRDGGRKAITEWVASVGEAPPCVSCVETPVGRPVLPRLGWLSERNWLGADLSARLLTVYARRPHVKEQFYVSMVLGIGNPSFDHEPDYANLREPDAGYRLLALYRFWNMVEYWFPNREITGEDWDGVLREFVPRLVSTRGREAYEAEMMALIARVHDTHANLWSSLDVRPPRGEAGLPVWIRFIEGRPVVTRLAHPVLGPASGLRVGDVIRTIGGVPVDTLVARWRPMYAASNEAASLRDMGRELSRGDPGLVRVSVERDGAPLTVDATRVPADSMEHGKGTHDLPGPTFRRLSGDLVYLKLSSVRQDDVGEYLRGAEGARCLVVDIRNYPSEFMVFALGQHLVREKTPFATFTTGDIRNPGAFDWGARMSLVPAEPYFAGGVAILVDEVTQSQAEYTAMALRARPGAVVVGSTTVGADGNVSAIPLPGGLRTMISGIGVFYPDHRPTQRVGIVPDLEVRPTIAGIRAGRDEVLEAAVQRVLGRPMTDAERAAAAPNWGLPPAR
jgi:C-terminal processing protease CtpA/Prc